MNNNTRTSNHDPVQGGATAEPAQQTVEAPAPDAKEGASHPRRPADLSAMLHEDAMLHEEKEHVVGMRGSELRRMVAPNDLFGLALSGGGIRSATFSLGILQALAQRGWIRKIDYLSTVSGGGYIASWLSAYIYRARKAGATDPVAAIERFIAPNTRPDDVEPTEIKFLRAYSSYLTPRLGLLSGDTLAVLAGLLRNLGLNLFLGAVSIFWMLAIIHWLTAIGLATIQLDPKYGIKVVGYVWLLMFWAPLCYISMFLTLQGYDIGNIKESVVRRRAIKFQNMARWLALLPLGINSVVAAIWFSLAPKLISLWNILYLTVGTIFFFALGIVLAYGFILYLLGRRYFTSFRRITFHAFVDSCRQFVSVIFAAGVCALVVCAVGRTQPAWLRAR
jgi:Patatin-like phospholipase